MMVSTFRRSLLLLAATTIGACSASITQDEGPGWSLAERSGGSAAPTRSEPLDLSQTDDRGAARPNPTAAAPGYGYKGGRDPVTGKANVVEGNSEKIDVPVKSVKATAAVGAATKPLSAPTTATQPKATGGRETIVAKGDTLHGLSLKHHVSVKSIMTANNLTTSKIYPGQKLVIPDAP